MKRTDVERMLVVVLFVFVITLFSFAEKESKTIEALYTKLHSTTQKLATVKHLFQKH